MGMDRVEATVTIVPVGEGAAIEVGVASVCALGAMLKSQAVAVSRTAMIDTDAIRFAKEGVIYLAFDRIEMS